MNNIYGRIRVTREPALALEDLLNEKLDALWSQHAGLPNPSPESRETLNRIRLFEKLLRVTSGTIIEKGWDAGAGEDVDRPERSLRTAG